MRVTETTKEESERAEAPDDVVAGKPIPGLVLVFSGDRPAFELIALERGAIDVGRGVIGGVRIDDERMSRAHARVAFDGRMWSVRDLVSRNGTAIDGKKLQGETAREAVRVIRTGSTLLLPTADIRLLRSGITRAGAMIMGPALQRAFKAVMRAARSGRILHITGESGSGKELVARAFHDGGPARSKPFVAVNAATLPENLAERLLFGARRGAYSGATDTRGLVQSAHGGTLFLDEVAELNLAVQAKLLRAIETGEVVPLGALSPERVDVRFCSATHMDLRARVAEGQMRADLFFRIGTPAVALRPLRERLEEIPWLVDHAVRRDSEVDLTPHVSLVEACILRHWPGNVRELLGAARQAAELAAEEGTVVLARHLDPHAGMAIEPPRAAAVTSPAPPPSRPSDDAITEALRAAGGNISRASRALGMHRNQLYRWMAQQKQHIPTGEES